ncbi:unnamed protein product [Dovyalis caffra]|uniref:Uncharacterized protein n=1 Tax=Dovyalis caffra TaxID=77055 RepID=A0AAV1R0B2_9ROSI|nr:unnamed protein product [Dovyalis caffra]
MEMVLSPGTISIIGIEESPEEENPLISPYSALTASIPPSPPTATIFLPRTVAALVLSSNPLITHKTSSKRKSLLTPRDHHLKSAFSPWILQDCPSFDIISAQC